MADGKVVYEIRGDNSKFQSDVNQTEKIAKSKTSAIGSFAKAAVVGIGTAVAAVGAGMVAFSKDAVGVGSEFDKSMSQVAATMGTTVDQISELRDFAMDMGATTAFSATEAAEALNYMALAGYDAETSMKMLPNVLNLAAAGNMSLARASDMVTDAQTALGLTLPETEKLVDKMAKTSSKTNTSVEQLGDAILTVGGTAKNLKGGTTELATMLGVLADNGIKGAEGGTALRNVILALSAPTDTAAKKLKELGVSAYDADGNMRALPDVFADLNHAMEGMTQGEKTEVLNTIFNKVDLKSANALLATTGSRFNELEAAIDGATGAAEQMAETQLDNLAGDVTLFKSALEGAKITLSNSITPAIRRFVQLGTAEIGKLDKAFQNGGIEGLADQFGKSLGNAVNMLSGYVPKFLRIAGKLVHSIADTILTQFPKTFPKIVSSITGFISTLPSKISGMMPKLVDAIATALTSLLQSAPALLQAGLELIYSIGEGVIKGLPKIGQAIIKGLSKPFGEAVNEANAHLDTVIGKIEELDGINGNLAESIAEINAKQKESEKWLEIYDSLYKKENLSKTEQEKLNTAVEHLQDLYPELGGLIDEETGKWIYNTDEIKNNIQAIKDRATAEAYYSAASDALKNKIVLEQELEEAVNNRKDAENRKTSIEADLEKQRTLVEELATADRDYMSGAKTKQQILDGLSQEVRDYAAAHDIAINSMEDLRKVESLVNSENIELQDAFRNVTEEISTYDQAIASAESGIEQYANKIDWFYAQGDAWSAKAAADAANVGAAIGDGLVQGLVSKTKAVSGAAGGLASTAINRMKSVAMIQSPSKRARKEVGAQIGQGEVLGLEDKIPDVKKASEKLINAIDLDVPSIDIPSITAGGENDTRINAIIAVLNKYLPRIGADIVLDTGELVGATVDKYDYELGVLQQRRARYE